MTPPDWFTALLWPVLAVALIAVVAAFVSLLASLIAELRMNHLAGKKWWEDR